MPTVVSPVLPSGWSVRPSARSMLRGGRSVLTCLVLSAVAIVAVPLQHATAPVSVDYRSDLAKLVRDARYTVVAPAGLPPSWTPVSSALAAGGANGPGTLTWHLGYMTPSGTLASLEETDARAAEFIRRMTNNGTLESPGAAGRADVEHSLERGAGPAVDVPHQPAGRDGRGDRRRELE